VQVYDRKGVVRSLGTTASVASQPVNVARNGVATPNVSSKEAQQFGNGVLGLLGAVPNFVDGYVAAPQGSNATQDVGNAVVGGLKNTLAGIEGKPTINGVQALHSQGLQGTAAVIGGIAMDAVSGFLGPGGEIGDATKVPEIAKDVESAGRDVNAAAKAADSGAAAAGQAAKGAGAPALTRDMVPNQGFATFDQLKAHLGSPGEGNQWHHVVEQSQITKSGLAPEGVHNVNNVVAVPSDIHAQISGFYSSKLPTGELVRNSLVGKSFDQQFQFGVRALNKFGSVTPTAAGFVFKR
jgi:hypothetical protein